MPYFADRVKTSSVSTGTGTITLSTSGEAGYQAFPASLNGLTVGYVIESNTDWEIGTGTFTDDPTSPTLTRSLNSSSTGSLLNLQSGTHSVFLSPSYKDLQIVEAFTSTSDLPSAADNHGRVYHVHGEGSMYFAHGGSWVKLANYTDIATSLAVSETAPTSPSPGDMWFDPSIISTFVYYNDGDTSQWVPANSVGSTGPQGPSGTIEWTRFYFDRGGATPGSAINNSENVGKNFGSWTETTSANSGSTYVTPTSSTYDPTLTGITVNSNGEFQFPAGVYEVNASIQFKIYNSSNFLVKYDFYLYGESGSDWAGSYDEQLLVPSTSLLTNNDMMIKMNGLYVFENATQANNILYLQMGTSSYPVNANMFPDFGFLDIKKIG